MAVLVVAVALVLATAPLPAGASEPAQLAANAQTLAFGHITLGSTSAGQNVRITNEGSTSAPGLAINGPSSNQFKITANGCPASLGAGASCIVTFAFAPTKTASAYGAARVTSSGGGAVSLNMYGTVDAPFFPMRVTPKTLDFGSVAVGTTAASQAVVVTNNSVTNYSINSTISGVAPPFSLVNNCAPSPKFLMHSGSCGLSFSFSPTASGDFSATLPLHIDVVGGGSADFTIRLTGHGGTAGAFPLRVTNRDVSFGQVAIGATSASQPLSITNTTASPVSFVAAGGGISGDFGGPGECGGNPRVLAAGATCRILYEAHPVAPGLRVGSSGVQLNVPGFPQRNIDYTMDAFGVGTAPEPVLSPTFVQLGTAPVGSYTPATSLRLRNQGNGTLTGVTVVVSGVADPRISFASTPNDCRTVGSLAAGASCDVAVRFRPTDSTGAGWSLSVTSNAATVNAYIQAGPRDSVYTALVNHLYVDFLDRFPTPTERSTTVSQLSSGALTKAALVSQLANSDEWVGAVVRQLYLDTLGRPGDSGGTAYWSGQIRTGAKTVAEVAAQLYASNEYFTNLGGGTNPTWITDLYVKILGRSPDSAGLAYWVGQTEAHGRINVAYRFFQSLESRRTRVTRLYGKLLYREPDVAGRDYWAGQIAIRGDIALAASLAVSPEYQQNASATGVGG